MQLMNHSLSAVLALLLLTACATPSKLVRSAGKALALKFDPSEAPRTLDLIAADPEGAATQAERRRFLRAWNDRHQPADIQLGDWRLIVDGDYAPGYFESLLPAEEFDLKGFTNRHTRPGRGIALVSHRDNKGREPVEEFYPPEGICRPVTAVFEPSKGKVMRLKLLDPMKREALAADFSAPFASLQSHTQALQRMGLTGLLGGKSSRARGHKLYLMEPYDPKKIPVIFIHGLLSTPLTWAEVTNEVWGDAEFRRQHQVWHYLYPTSAPFLYSAWLYRQRIDEMRRFLDPDGNDPASQHLDIVAHSMGGLLTRTLITDTGDAVWDQVFRVPSGQLQATETDRQAVYGITHWKPRRDVRRVIFIASPHRGSSMSLRLIGRIGDKLAGLPVQFTGLYARIHRNNPDALQPGFSQALSRGQLTSIDTLSPDHPLLETLLALPIPPKVKIHSIIGDRGKPGTLTESSDGVVPYLSSHLKNALSELIVPTGHGAMKHPKSHAEIRRILND